MISCSRFIILPALVAALALLGRLSVVSASPPYNPLTLSSHHHRHRPSAAEQTFVRGMMAADHQFGLYMTLSETSRGGGSSNTFEEEDGRCTKNNHPTIRACEDAIINARKAAFRFGNGLRREAIRHMRLDDKHSE